MVRRICLFKCTINHTLLKSRHLVPEKIVNKSHEWFSALWRRETNCVPFLQPTGLHFGDINFISTTIHFTFFLAHILLLQFGFTQNKLSLTSIITIHVAFSRRLVPHYTKYCPPHVTKRPSQSPRFFTQTHLQAWKLWNFISDMHKDFRSENFCMTKDCKTIGDKVAKVMWVL